MNRQDLIRLRPGAAQALPGAEPCTVLCTAGRLHLKAEGIPVTLAAGELLNTARPVEILAGEGEGRWFRWPDEAAALQPAGTGFGLRVANPEAAACAALMQTLAALERELAIDAPGAGLMARALLLQAAVQAARMPGTALRGETAVPVEELARRYLEENYAQPLTLELLSERFFVSKYHLSHAFRRHCGVSVYQYLMRRRLQAARAALEAGATPGEAFAACGFGDYANFYRAFKTEYGCGPRGYAAAGPK